MCRIVKKYCESIQRGFFSPRTIGVLSAEKNFQGSVFKGKCRKIFGLGKHLKMYIVTLLGIKHATHSSRI